MVESGIPAVQFETGDHVCAFYDGEEGRDSLLMPFLEAGLRSGDKCVAVLDHARSDRYAARLAVEPKVNQLDIVSADDAYLVDGRFETERMLRFWDEQVGHACRDDGFVFTRSVGEMTWSLRDAPGVDELVGYESRLNEFLPIYPQIILCLYDITRFDAATVIGMMRTHPKVILGGELIVNPYYQESATFLESRRDD